MTRRRYDAPVVVPADERGGPARRPDRDRKRVRPREAADMVHMEAYRLRSLAGVCDLCGACEPYDGDALRDMAALLDTMDARMRASREEGGDDDR